ncbi:MAG: NAD(P)-binding protein [Nitrososphaerota archaeon]
MLSTDIVVLGGGWAGISYCLECKLIRPGTSIVILERQKTVGGLLRSEIVRGHVFDVGGSHIIFSRNKTILNKMLNILDMDVLEHSRRTFIMLLNQFIPYPLENNLSLLPQNDKIDALISFLEAWNARTNDFAPKNLYEWVYGFFGKWIAEKYLVPYNLKIWKRELREIDVDWIYMPGRLPIPDWRDVVRSAMGQPTIGYVEQSKFYYPRRGGIQRLFDATMKRAVEMGVKYIKGYKIMSVKRTNNGWLINGEIHAKKLVSSIPLNELISLMEAPEHVIKMSNELDYNRVLVVGLAIDKPAPKQHWIYVPMPDVIFHRYAWISNYSFFNAPPNKSTLIAEITIPAKSAINVEKCVEKTVEDLEKLGVIEKREIIFTTYWLHEYGYPVHTIKSNEARNNITRWLMEQGVTLIGRWGCWQYWNMDKVYEDVIDKLEELG